MIAFKFSELKKKKNFTLYIIMTLIVFFFVLSFLLFKMKDFGQRKMFIFPSADEGKYVVEYRNLNRNNAEMLDYYIDEILLGSGVERTKKLFATGTKVQSCFVRENVLYLDLSSDLMNVGNDTVDIKEGVNLLEKNIKKNFPKLKEIKIFVDGKLAFEN